MRYIGIELETSQRYQGTHMNNQVDVSATYLMNGYERV